MGNLSLWLMFLSFPSVLSKWQIRFQMDTCGCWEGGERKGQYEALAQPSPHRPFCKPFTNDPEPRKSAGSGKYHNFCLNFCFVLFFLTFFVSQPGINLHAVQIIPAFI